MRRRKLTKIYLIAAIVCACCFCPAGYSQNPEDKTRTDERKEKEREEVEKFADEFIKSLELTHDLNQVPGKFFEAGFKGRLSENDTWGVLSGNENLRNQFSGEERFENNVSWINFFNLVGVFFCENSKSGPEDEGCDDSLRKTLPPHIVELFLKNRWLRNLIEDENGNSKDPAPATPAEHRSLLAELNTSSEAMRAEVKRRHLKFSKNPNMNEYFPPEECEGERCRGLPEKTVIFSIHKSFMCLRIVRVNNELRIVNINNAALEN